jgi:hypothetical protein
MLFKTCKFEVFSHKSQGVSKSRQEWQFLGLPQPRLSSLSALLTPKPPYPPSKPLDQERERRGNSEEASSSFIITSQKLHTSFINIPLSTT